MPPGQLRVRLMVPMPADKAKNIPAVDASNTYKHLVVRLQLPYPHRNAIEVLDTYLYTDALAEFPGFRDGLEHLARPRHLLLHVACLGHVALTHVARFSPRITHLADVACVIPASSVTPPRRPHCPHVPRRPRHVAHFAHIFCVTRIFRLANLTHLVRCIAPSHPRCHPTHLVYVACVPRTALNNGYGSGAYRLTDHAYSNAVAPA
ncbi:uncharacterized protein BXZ73DRAFT_109139 [Epithele typhae]|uniref:uncharacterized protein n=1 Tax=Epithele typhae TaxID=378194 RepID=UPI002008CCF8|nr:uncharacterized protein BXZ73DRAFT_109139 [Epithele typhae]KAH9910338.1 hypothetical protein BXZ73DRAFT_109139 [Epithele typhae]